MNIARVGASLSAVLIALSLAPSVADAATTNKATVVSGDGQIAPRTGDAIAGGIAVFQPLVVLISDANGKPVSGVRVTFTCSTPTTMGCNASGNGTNTAIALGSAQTLGAYGKATITAQASSGKSVAFTLTTVEPTSAPVAAPIATPAPTVMSAGIAIAASDNQKPIPDFSGLASFAPLSVKAFSATGAPVANVPITFDCTSPNPPTCQFDPSGTDHGRYIVATDANGTATLNRMPQGASMTLFRGTGPFTVTASVSSGAAKVTFHENVGTVAAAPPTPVTPAAPPALPAAATLAVASGDNQKVTPDATGLATFAAMSVKLVSATGAPVAFAPVTFVCQVANGAPCRFLPSGADNGTSTVKTNANGAAALTGIGGAAMTVLKGSGVVTVTATTSGLSATLHGYVP